MADTYKIIRFYQDRPGFRYTVARHLTLEEAKEHCNDPETSSRTATNSEAIKRTERVGPWFDGFTKE